MTTKNRSRRCPNRPCAVLFATVLLLMCFRALPAFSQDDVVKFVEDKRMELQAREDRVKKEEARLDVLRKDVDQKIDRYTKLLGKLEIALKKAEQIRDERLLNVAKLYEAMSPEEAAAKLVDMDDATAVQIMLRMKSKKAGAIIALFSPKKAVAITKDMASVKINK
jgi:flagellar motility protein MotE (MotC chaperone)